MKHIIDTDELEKLRLDVANNQCTVKTATVLNMLIENYQALLTNSPQADGMVLALNNAELQKRISVLEDLLSSAYNIANRNGENTHWQRFAGQLHVNGISPITAKTFKILPSDTELSAYKPQAVLSGQGLVVEMPQADDVLEQAAQAIDSLASSGENKDDWTVTRDLAFHRASEAVRALISGEQAEGEVKGAWVPKLGEIVNPSKSCCEKYQEWKPNEKLKIVGMAYKRICCRVVSDEIEYTTIELSNPDSSMTDGWTIDDIAPDVSDEAMKGK